MKPRRKTFWGSVALGVFITACIYGLDTGISGWLLALVFLVSVIAIFGFTDRFKQQLSREAPPSKDPRSEVSEH